ncbi:MAG: hypothetical protein IPM26_09650 [Saprospiraceae bacterium]|nr:hypothetical protein [Saprospiraceae bacterium]
MKLYFNLSALLSLCVFTCFTSFCKAQTIKDTMRYLFKPEWKEFMRQTPIDIRKWSEFEINARMYAKYAIPEEKVLPVVFNVIHLNNEVKVTKEDITLQLQVLNDAFAGKTKGEHNFLFEKVIAGDSKIRFCLGSPDGIIDGIYTTNKSVVYSISNLGSISDKNEGLEGAIKDQYINVWISELADELGGFAILPGHDAIRDGIYIDPDFFGVHNDQKKYNSGKTLVHLMGQYLGLLPLWTNGDCMDDGVEDTPVHNAPNDHCFGAGHISLCPGNPMEMIGNFMDSNPDDCAWFFTIGQVARMHAALSEIGYRHDLIKGQKICDGNAREDDENLDNRSTIKNLDFTIVPNPAETQVEIWYENPHKTHSVSIDVYNMTNQRMYEKTIPALGEHKGRIIIDIKDWPAAHYYVTLKTGMEVKTKTLMAIK